MKVMFGQDTVTKSWHLINGYGYWMPCPININRSLAVQFEGLPPQGSGYCPICWNYISEDDRAWITDREVRHGIVT